MIKVVKEEFLNEDNLAVAYCKVVFLGIPIYKSTITTSNKSIINNLALTANCSKQVKGF